MPRFITNKQSTDLGIPEGARLIASLEHLPKSKPSDANFLSMCMNQRLKRRGLNSTIDNVWPSSQMIQWSNANNNREPCQKC